MVKEIPLHKGKWLVGSAAEFSAGSHEFLLDLAKEHGDIVTFGLGPMSFTLVSNPEMIREVLITRAKYFPKADRDMKIMNKFIGEGLVTSKGDHHKKQRKMSQPAFHMKRVASYAEVMSQYTADMLDSWQDRDVIDISDEMFRLTMYIVTKTIFDVDKDVMADQANRIGEAIHRLQELTDSDFNSPIDLPEWVPTRLNRQRKQERKVLYAAIDDILEARKPKDGIVEDHGDLLSMLLLTQYEDNEFLSDQELRDQLVTLFSAGHETTSNALTWTWYALSQNPEVLARLQAEVDEVLDGRLPTFEDLKELPYTEMVIKESMRIYPSVWMLNSRQPIEDTTIGEYAVKKGTQLALSPYVMHHLPQYFPDPERFEPERFSAENADKIQKYSYFPFGAGGRVCIGQAFAMMEARLILATMIQNFDFELVPDQTIEAYPLVTMSIKDGLKMSVTKRVHTAVEAAPEMMPA